MSVYFVDYVEYYADYVGYYVDDVMYYVDDVDDKTIYLLQNVLGRAACSYPPEIPNAMHDGSPEKQTHELGTMLQYECLPNYVLNRDAVVRAWCVGGGGWVGPNMTCTSKSKVPPTPASVNGAYIQIH